MEQALAKVEVELLQGDHFLRYWPCISQEMDRIPHVWDTWWTKESIYEGCCNGRFQVWAAGTETTYQVILITQIAYYPANRILQGILILGNHIEDCAPMLDVTLENWGRKMGCTICEVVGRPGWYRFLKKYGFSRSAVVLNRVISEHRVQ